MLKAENHGIGTEFQFFMKSGQIMIKSNQRWRSFILKIEGLEKRRHKFGLTASILSGCQLILAQIMRHQRDDIRVCCILTGIAPL